MQNVSASKKEPNHVTYRMEAAPVNMVTVVISARILAVNAINVLLAHVAIQSVTKVRILFNTIM